MLKQLVGFDGGVFFIGTSDPLSFSSEKSHERECVNKNLDVFMICLGVAVMQCSLCHYIFLSISSVFFCLATSYHL